MAAGSLEVGIVRTRTKWVALFLTLCATRAFGDPPEAPDQLFQSDLPIIEEVGVIEPTFRAEYSNGDEDVLDLSFEVEVGLFELMHLGLELEGPSFVVDPESETEWDAAAVELHVHLPRIDEDLYSAVVLDFEFPLEDEERDERTFVFDPTLVGLFTPFGNDGWMLVGNASFGIAEDETSAFAAGGGAALPLSFGAWVTELQWINDRDAESEAYLSSGVEWNLFGALSIGTALAAGLNDASADFQVLTFLSAEID